MMAHQFEADGKLTIFRNLSWTRKVSKTRILLVLSKNWALCCFPTVQEKQRFFESF